MKATVDSAQSCLDMATVMVFRSTVCQNKYLTRKKTNNPISTLDDPSVPFAKDDIKTEYHPHSRKVPTVQSFNTYQRRPTSPPVEASAHNNSLPPWSPFRSRLDFEVASLALDAALKKEHVEALISLLKRCGRDPQQFTIQNAADIDDTWTLATHKAPEVGICVPQYLYMYKNC